MSESTIRALLVQQHLKTAAAQGVPITDHLPMKFSEAVASVCNLISDGGDPVQVKEAFTELASRNRELTEDKTAIADALASQVQLLERLFLRYVQRAEACTKPEHRHLAMRTALACQRQTLSALSALYQVQHAEAGA